MFWIWMRAASPKCLCVHDGFAFQHELEYLGLLGCHIRLEISSPNCVQVVGGYWLLHD
jgi:hypothetical protein